MDDSPASIGEGPTVCIDFKNPRAYLALRPTFALEDALGRHFEWLPIVLSPLSRPSTPRPDEDRGTRHRRMRAEYNEMDLRRYAQVQGLQLGDLYRNPDTSIACIGLLWATRASHLAQRRYLQRTFDAYWSGRLDLADRGAIAGVLDEVGVALAGWDDYLATEGRTTLDDTCAALRAVGVFDVPAYLVEGDVFFGRQHLPMVHWLLDGKRGEPPL